MNNCPNDSEVFVAAQGPHGNGGRSEDARPNRNAFEEADAAKDARQREEAARTNTIQRINDTISPNSDPTPPGNAANATDAASLRRGARHLSKLIDDAAAGTQNLFDEFERAYAFASESTVGETSKWFDIVNSMFGRFANDRAAFYKFVATYFRGDPNQSIMGNRIIKNFELMQSKIVGAKQGYERMHSDILKTVTPIAKRVGMDAESLAAYIGHYANARHMPERNAHILAQWDADISALKMSGPIEKVMDLQEKRLRLEMFLNDIDPPEDLYSGGMTNGQARKVMDDVLARGITKEEAEAVSDMYVNMARQILQDRVDAGLVDADTLRSFPDFNSYLPVKTRPANKEGAFNDMTGYNPGTYHAIQGRVDAPDSAYYTVLQYGRRAANEIGTRDFGMDLAAMYEIAQQRGMDIGLREVDYPRLTAEMNSGNPRLAEAAKNLMLSGFVVDVPIPGLDGSISHKRRKLYYFDKGWKDENFGLDGSNLASTIQNVGRVATGFESIAKWTNRYSQLFTRFQPAFAVVNTFRDTGERLIHLMSREYYNDATGERISGASIAGSYVANTPRAGAILQQALRGELDPNTQMGAYWREYEQYGLYQKFMQRTRNERLSLDDVTAGRTLPQEGIRKMLDKPELSGFKQALDKSGALGSWVLEKLDGWNDYWNNIASFNQFLTLREAGVDVRSAAHGTLELMNLYQTGSWTPMLRVLFPFVKPTIQGGMAMSRSLGITGDLNDLKRRGPKAAATILGGYAALTALMPLLREGMGDDEKTGMNRLDQLSLSEIQRFLPIGDGTGAYAKIPYGFGIGQLIATLAFGMDRVQRGIMSPNDLAYEMAFAVFNNTSPTGKPNFDISKDPVAWLTQAISPALLQPLMQVATNRNFFGGKVTWATNEEEKAAAAQGRMSTPKFYHDAARELLATTGFDLAPEQLKTLADGLLVGPLRILQGTLIQDGVKKGSQEGNARETLGPVLSTLGATMFYGEKHATNQALFYQALDRYVSEIRKDNIDIALPSNLTRASAEEKDAYFTEKLKAAGKSDDFIDDYLILRAARSALRSSGQKFSKSMRATWLSSTDGSELKEQFMALAEEENDVYAAVINSLNYYNDAR